MIHRGEIVEKIVRERGYPISKIAKRMGKSRRHVYNLFESSSIPFDVIAEIGTIIGYDFAINFKELRPYEARGLTEAGRVESFSTGQEELLYCKRELESVKNKYIRLLEQYNELLRERMPRG